MDEDFTMEGLESQFKAALVGIEDHPGITLQIDAITAWSVLVSLQLACRHPQYIGPARDIAKGIARQIQDALAQTPALAVVAEMGWHAEYDMEAEGITAITREEWDDIFPEHKLVLSHALSIVEGVAEVTVVGDQRYILVGSSQGSVLVPVEIEEGEEDV